MKCYLSLRWRWVRVVASFSLAAAAMGIMHDSRAVPIEGITQYHLTLSRWVGDDNIVLGEGFFSFDQRAVDRKLNKWLADPDSFPFLFFPIELPVIEAEFEIFGHTFHADFHDDEIRWVEEYDDQGVVINVFVTMGDVSPFRVPPFIDFAAGFDQGQFLYYDVNGSFADCIRGIL